MSVYRGKEHDDKTYGLFCNKRAADIPPVDVSQKKGSVQFENEYKKQEEKNIVDELLGNGIDQDKLLIAALLYMLIKEGADMKLIIALGYILL